MKHSNIAVFIPNAGCPNQCSFCDQRTISGAQAAPAPEQVRNILLKSAPYLKSPEETEVAFFGGSFTAIDRDYMLALLEVAANFVQEYGLAGIRISTRPDAIDDVICETLRRYSVHVVELGAQSMVDSGLSMNRRGHTAADIERASKMLKGYGFQLGLQMMTGLYGSTPALDCHTAKRFIGLCPDMIRIYPTVTLKGTVLEKLYQNGVYIPQTLEQAVEQCSRLYRLFLEANIPVIRLGLHASSEIEESYVAGAYHPAFRELCESRMFLEQTLSLLERCPKGNYILGVAPRSHSKMAGQHRDNLKKLREYGYCVKLLDDAALGAYEIRLREGTACF